MSKIVVYFSHAGENYFNGGYKKLDRGNASVIAEKLANMLGCETFEIVPKIAYPNTYKAACDAALKEKKEGILPPYEGYIDVSGYSDVYLVYPCWWGTCPQVVFKFLKDQRFNSSTTIHPICTHEGSEMGTSERDLAKDVSPARVGPGLAIRGSDRDNCDGALSSWI